LKGQGDVSILVVTKLYPRRNGPMTTTDFIIELFCRADEQMQDVEKHPRAKLYPSEFVTLALLFASKAPPYGIFTAGSGMITCRSAPALLVCSRLINSSRLLSG
jgi:hypothetical protein